MMTSQPYQVENKRGSGEVQAASESHKTRVAAVHPYLRPEHATDTGPNL